MNIPRKESLQARIAEEMRISKSEDLHELARHYFSLYDNPTDKIMDEAEEYLSRRNFVGAEMGVWR